MIFESFTLKNGLCYYLKLLWNFNLKLKIYLIEWELLNNFEQMLEATQNIYTVKGYLTTFAEKKILVSSLDYFFFFPFPFLIKHFSQNSTEVCSYGFSWHVKLKERNSLKISGRNKNSLVKCKQNPCPLNIRKFVKFCWY